MEPTYQRMQNPYLNQSSNLRSTVRIPHHSATIDFSWYYQQNQNASHLITNNEMLNNYNIYPYYSSNSNSNDLPNPHLYAYGQKPAQIAQHTFAQYSREYSIEAETMNAIDSHPLPNAYNTMSSSTSLSNISMETRGELFKEGLELYTSKKFDKSALTFSLLVKIAPNESSYWKYLGDSYFYLKDYMAAYSALAKAQDLDPTNPQNCLNNMIVCLQQQIKVHEEFLANSNNKNSTSCTNSHQ